MRKILRSRLPQRVRTVPPFLVELAVGLVLGIAGVTVRSALSPALGDLAPYALNFVAMTLAAVIAGWRAGLVA